MLEDEVAGAAHAVDFLHPRKRPEPPSQKNRNLLIGAAVATALLAIVGTVWGRLHSLDRQIADLKSESADMNDVVDRANSILGKVQAIDQFQDGDITWLDELREASVRLPGPDDAILDELSFGAAIGGGGTMLLKGHVRDSSLIEVFEDSLRYHGNDVAGKHGAPDAKRPEYPFQLETTVFVSPDSKQEGHSAGRPYRDEIRELASRAMNEAEPADEEEEKEADQSDQNVTSTENDEDSTGSQSS
jgi:hypothetical protein